MRKFTVSLLILLLVIGCQQAVEKPIDVEAEKAAIKQLVKDIWKTWDNKNYEGWVSYFVQGPNSLYGWVNPKGLKEHKGWSAIESLWKGRFETALKNDSETYFADNVFENFTFKIWKDAAWVTYDFYSKEDKVKDPDYLPWKTYWVLENAKDGWKILSWINVPRDWFRKKETE
jgi:hypothetical protein